MLDLELTVELERLALRPSDADDVGLDAREKESHIAGRFCERRQPAPRLARRLVDEERRGIAWQERIIPHERCERERDGVFRVVVTARLALFHRESQLDCRKFML